MTVQQKKIMIYSDTGAEDNILKPEESLPPHQLTMNQNYSNSFEEYVSHHDSSSVWNHPEYCGESSSRPFCKSILLWSTAKDFRHIILLLAFAFAIISLNAVSGEQQSAVYDTSNNFNTDSDPNGRPPITTTTKPCFNCNKDYLEVLANITLQKIKAEILHKMFPNGPPNTTSKMPPAGMLSKISDFDMFELTGSPSHIRHESSQKFGPQYQKDAARFLEGGDDSLKRHKVIARAKEIVNPGSGYPKRPLLFSFESLSQSKVTSARLLLYQKAIPKNISSRSFKLIVIKLSPKGLQTTVKQFEKDLNDTSGWLDFDFEPEVAMKHFNNDDDDSLQLSLIIYARYMQQDITGDVPLVLDLKKCDNMISNEPDCQNVPYLQLEIEEQNRRNKRSTYPDCPLGSKDYNSCCRYPLIVDFEAFKWDFIIAPKRYNAHYCAGECNYLSQQNYVHTHLQTLVAQKSDNKIIPCCGPRSMTAITMLYFNSKNNIVYGNLPGMVVESCGCQ